MSHARTSSPINYRPDIDGLRALAVLPVLLFHVFPKWMPGGYIGVDIFFVISGYLITSILLGEVAENKFSVLKFYIRRARRLFPALFTVLLVVLIFGYFALLPHEFMQLGKHILAGATFLSNIVLWREVGYFDASAEHKPLLHLWSLGVEEQYYLLWPLLVAFLARRPRLFYPATILLILLSFGLNIAFLERSASAVFYLPITRFWELLIGSLLAFLVRNRLSVHGDRLSGMPAGIAIAPRVLQILSVTGVSMILIALFKLDKNTEFPGWAALLPVMGAACIIAAGPKAAINRTILSSPAAVWIGLISYPLYLWHWPLIAYARLMFGDALSIPLGCGLLIAAVGLSWLTYRFIEQSVTAPRRRHLAGLDAVRLWGLLGSLGVCGVAVWLGYAQARSADSTAAQSIAAAQSDWENIDNGNLQGDRPERVLFIGDSYMQQYLPRIKKIMDERTAPVYTVQIMTRGGCAPLRGVERKSIACSQFVDAAYKAASDPLVKTIVIAASWWGFSIRDDYYAIDESSHKPIHPFADENRWIFTQWTNELAQLIKDGKHVVLVGASPSGPLVGPEHLVDRATLNWHTQPPSAPDRTELEFIVAVPNKRIFEIAQHTGAEIVNPFDWLCDAHSCKTLTDDSKPIFKDDSHLRATYVRKNLSMLDKFIYVRELRPALN